MTRGLNSLFRFLLDRSQKDLRELRLIEVAEKF